jgi:hypothetical protein
MAPEFSISFVVFNAAMARLICRLVSSGVSGDSRMNLLSRRLIASRLAPSADQRKDAG